MFWRKKTPEKRLEESKKRIDILSSKLVVEQLKASYYSKLVREYKRIV